MKIFCPVCYKIIAYADPRVIGSLLTIITSHCNQDIIVAIELTAQEKITKNKSIDDQFNQIINSTFHDSSNP